MQNTYKGKSLTGFLCFAFNIETGYRENYEKTITAVVFDMDGVLFDTERIYMECWREAAELRDLKMWMRSPKPASAEPYRARRKYSRQQRQSRALTSPLKNCMRTAAVDLRKRKNGMAFRRSRGANTLFYNDIGLFIHFIISLYR